MTRHSPLAHFRRVPAYTPTQEVWLQMWVWCHNLRPQGRRRSMKSFRSSLLGWLQLPRLEGVEEVAMELDGRENHFS